MFTKAAPRTQPLDVEVSGHDKMIDTTDISDQEEEHHGHMMMRQDSRESNVELRPRPQVCALTESLKSS